MHQIVLPEVVAAGFAISAESATRNEIVRFLALDVALAMVLNELEACVANGPQVEPCVSGCEEVGATIGAGVSIVELDSCCEA